MTGRTPDPVSLTGGVLAGVVGLLAVTGTVDVLVDARTWVVPGALLAVGAAGLFATTFGRRRNGPPEPPPPEAPPS